MHLKRRVRSRWVSLKAIRERRKNSNPKFAGVTDKIAPSGYNCGSLIRNIAVVTRSILRLRLKHMIASPKLEF